MKSIQHSVSLWFGIIMVIVLLSWSLALVFTDFMADRLSGNKRWLFIIMLMGYCIYRGYRIYDTVKQTKNEEQQL